MSKFFFCLVILIGVQRSAVFAQKDTIVFDGTISVAKSDTYKYKIVVGFAEGKWKGYSVLDGGGPNETRSTVTMSFSKEKESCIFAEKSLISTRSKETTFCFVGGMLKMNDKKSTLKGFFLGHDNNKGLCGSGTVKFVLPEAARKLMTPDGTKDTNTADILTSFKSQSYRATQGKVNLELWDGGINDHDSLRVSLNGAVIMDAVEIMKEKRVIPLTLKKGENIITIRALNEGLEPPNSARINVVDQSQSYPLVSFLRKGEEATLKIKL